MKQLLKKVKQISMLLLAISLIGCEDNDVIMPEVISSFTYTMNADTGTVTFINTSVNSRNYFWTFEDKNGNKTSSTEIEPVKTFTTGEYKVTLKATNVAGASDTSEDIIVISDAGAPVITLLGETTINILVGGTFSDPGATATDDVDGDLTANIVVAGDAVDVNTAATYTITYNVSDAAGNAATERTRTVIVAADTVAPVITLTGNATINIMVGDTYTDEGATATDVIDGDITANIVVAGDAVDVNTAGTYTITYNVSDAAGNAADEVTRKVIVEDGNAYNYPDASDVISVYSDLYTDIADTNFNPGWGQATVVSEVDSDGGKAMLYSTFNYQGINLGSADGVPQDVSGKKYLHVEYKTANAAALNVFLIGGGETPVALDVSSSEWQKVDILLTEFTAVNLANVNQIKFDGGTGSEDVYIDNIFFHGTGDGGGDTGPTVAAPTPTVDAANVVSLYSDAYTDISSNFDAGWCGANSVSEVLIDGNNTQYYLNNGCQGIDFSANKVDATTLTNVHIDFYTTETDLIGKVFNLKLVDFGSGTTEVAALEININDAIVNGNWVSIDVAVDLSTFTGLAQAAITTNLQNKVWYDNFYLYK